MYRRLCALLDRWLRIPPEPETPPGHDAVVFRAAPAFFRYRMVGWVLSKLPLVLLLTGSIGMLLVTAFDGHSTRGEPLQPVLLGICLLIPALVMLEMGVSLLCLRLDYEKRWYVLTDRSLRVREGVWTVREMTVTFANIQNISIEQGPLQRLFKIADLKVDTAGGGGVPAARGGAQSMANSLHSARFRGVDNAEAIKLLMQQRLHGTRDSGLGDTDDTGAGAPVAAAGLTALLREMVTEARALRRAAEQAGPRPPAGGS